MEVLNSNKLYEKYGGYIGKLSNKLAGDFWNTGLDAGEIEQIAWEAAMRCFSRYTGFNAKGESVKFETYVAYRIRGSIIDEIRVRGGTRTTKGGVRTFTPYTTEYLEDLSEVELGDNLEGVKEQELRDHNFEKILLYLRDERGKYVLRMRYIYELSLTEIGLTLGISPVRVSQIEAESTGKLRVLLKAYGVSNDF